jgi:hypothetical protein
VFPNTINGHVDNRLSFADQEKEASVFNFRIQQTNGSYPLSFSGLKQTNESCRFLLVPFSVCGIPETWRWGHGDIGHRGMEKQTENGSPSDFP